MLVGLFRRNQPAVLAALPVLVVALRPGGASSVARAAAWEGMPLHALVKGWTSSLWWAPTALGVVLVCAIAFQLVWTLNASELFPRRNHLTALYLVLLLGLLPDGFDPDPALMGMPFTLWAMRRVWAVQGDRSALGAVFDAGLLLGLASLFFLPYAFLVAVLWASISVMRPFNWREYLLPPIGWAVVLFIAWGLMRLLAPGTWHVPGVFEPGAQRAEPWFAPHWLWPVLGAVVLGAHLVRALPVFAQDYARGVMREKNMRASLLALFFALLLVAGITWWGGQPLPPILLCVPLAVLLASPALRAKHLVWPEVGALAFLALGLWVRWA